METETLQLIVRHFVSSVVLVIVFWLFDQLLRALFKPENAVITWLVYLEDFAFLAVFGFLIWNVLAEFYNRRVRLNRGHNVSTSLFAFAL